MIKHYLARTRPSVKPHVTQRQSSLLQTVSIQNENFPMQYTEIFSAVKIEKNNPKNVDIFNIFAQNIDCGYTLEPPR